jgi:hypothetical protein
VNIAPAKFASEADMKEVVAGLVAAYAVLLE